MGGFELKNVNGELPGKSSEKQMDVTGGVSVGDRTWRHWLLGIVVFLYFTGLNMGLFIIGQYVYRRIQIETYPNKTFETGISYCINSPNVSLAARRRLAHVQEDAAGYNLIFNTISCVPSIAVNIIFGSYTDKFGRKFLMIIAMTGALLRVLICVLGVYSSMNLYLFGIVFGVEGICGQAFALLLASYAYVSDITHRKNRAIGIVLNEACVGLGISVSTLIGGYFLQAYGFKSPLLVSAGLLVVAILITVFLLPESYPKEKRRVSSERCNNLRQAVEFYYASWNDGLRLKYIISILVFFFTMVTVLGRSSIETLYQLNAPFCWTPQKLGLFSSLRTLLLQVVGMISIALFKLFLDDDSIAIIGSISFAASFITEGLAKNDVMIYIVTVVGSLGMLTVPMIRSIMSRMTSPDRQGALAASISVVETSCHLFSNVMLNAIYRATVAETRGS
ncbi:proton-coupled folate transporter-like isoform X2 [Mercenaria mercenaria]|uniref:proton-coupled folate transporter-like isoform X2 n=1 Tax=Mercenaria mercenaria TaxID=6596 RepID=UPI00234F22F7|nr:proton-coupled folate transporter-like isoform X2 [Mercenaria mercenaria]